MIRRLCAILIVVCVVAVLVSPLVDLDGVVHRHHHRTCAGAQLQNGLQQASSPRSGRAQISDSNLLPSFASALLAPLRC